MGWSSTGAIAMPHTAICVRGFILIELLMGIAILAVMLTLAAPSYGKLIGRIHGRVAHDEIDTALNLARLTRSATSSLWSCAQVMMDNNARSPRNGSTAGSYSPISIVTAHIPPTSPLFASRKRNPLALRYSVPSVVDASSINPTAAPGTRHPWSSTRPAACAAPRRPRPPPRLASESLAEQVALDVAARRKDNTRLARIAQLVRALDC